MAAYPLHWWQPEPEHPPEHTGIQSQTDFGISFSPTLDYSSESVGTPKNNQHAFISTFAEPAQHEHDPASIGNVVRQMSNLNDTLCTWLYGDGICADSGVPDIAWEPFAAIPAFEDKDAISEPIPQVAHLHSVQDRLSQLLRHLYDAADLALKIDATQTPEEASHQFLEDYYCLLDPAGIAERQAENDEFEEELNELEINWLGHIFVFDRPGFLREIQNAPEAIRKDLIAIALKHVPDAGGNVFSRTQYEELYCSACEDAWAWQFQVPDVDDQDEGLLLPLLKTLRRLVQNT